MRKVIAVDFDGTLFENAWPGIGAPRVNVIAAALREQQNGAALIRIQQWRPGLYSSKYCQSAEEAARYLWEVRTK